MSRRMGVLVVAACAICVALVASAAGWLGGVEVCGADRSLGCVSWPMPVSLVIWAAFIAGVAALVVWQTRFLDD